MSISTSKGRMIVTSVKSQSYPGSPHQRNGVRANLTDVFQEYENDLTITPTGEESSIYQTALIELNDHGLKSDLISSNHIENVENIRTQLKDFLNPYDKDEHSDISNISDTSSVDTVALLQGALPQSSPELQLDENGVLMTSLSSLSRKSLQSAMSPELLDSSLVAENTILKENIEKERCRRKHCEQQIHELQDKLLECQENLAVATSTERKKGIMIEQVDQTLASVVEGWKKQEASRVESYNQLKLQKDELEASKTRQEELLSQFEAELEETVNSMNKEKEQTMKLNAEHEAMLENLYNQIKDLKDQIDSLKNDNLLLEEQRHDLLQEKATSTSERQQVVDALNKNLESEKMDKKKLIERFSGNEEKLKTLVRDLEHKLKSAFSEIENLRKHLKDADSQILENNSEVELARKEKESLSMEVTLLTSKYDALKTKQDSEIRLKLESEFNQQILEIQQQITATENELRTSQKKQINELGNRHKEEMENQKRIFQQDLQKKDEMLKKLREDYDKDLQNARDEISSLSMASQTLESQRSELMKRMKQMMQQHWEDTVTLLNSNQKTMGHSGYSAPGHLSSTFRSDIQRHQNYQQQRQDTMSNFEYSHPAVHQSSNRLIQSQNPSLASFSMLNTGNRRITAEPSFRLAEPVFPGYNATMENYPTLQNGQKESITDQRYIETNLQHHRPLNRFANVENKSLLSTPHPNNKVYQDQFHPHEPQIHPQHNITPFATSDSHLLHSLRRQSSPLGYCESNNGDPTFPVNIQQQTDVSFRNNLQNRSNSQTHLPTTSSPIKSASLVTSATTRMTPQLTGRMYAANVYDHSHNDNIEVQQQENLQSSLQYQDLDDETDVDEMTRDKEKQLSHFIEKLLERSPGQPLDEVPVKDVQEEKVSDSIKRGVDQLLYEQTTPKKQPIKINAAFKKSVVRTETASKAKDSIPNEENYTEEELMSMLKRLMTKESLEKQDSDQHRRKEKEASPNSNKKTTKKIEPTHKTTCKRTTKGSSKKAVKETSKRETKPPRNSAWK